uniref:Uncharacterized protein n=1 Tax=Candidatus Kentrum sp. LPFa TaxID=2126335 RepID=A0A450XB87_9GAMM|nr:MAG: hypothetical protein BECKLPF1236A_GA0070988_1003718 [Candidatus Kentron sp. LPFa]VFK26543.1 MAG: hypothetical protein BECKLPF1236C_GA0070990_1003617 [Candidatus Kentron sp. LPFa]
MLITFDFGGASLCHEILHFVQKSLGEKTDYLILPARLALFVKMSGK